MPNSLNTVRVTAIVQFDVTRNMDIPELTEYARNEMWIRLQQGNVWANEVKTEVVE